MAATKTRATMRGFQPVEARACASITIPTLQIA
jgi:hypothetical protein